MYMLVWSAWSMIEDAMHACVVEVVCMCVCVCVWYGCGEVCRPGLTYVIEGCVYKVMCNLSHMYTYIYTLC